MVFDSGVRTGADVVKAIALGATAVAIGRPYVYGLALGGVPGAVHVLRSLQAEADLVMAVDGYPTLSDLTRDALVRLHGEFRDAGRELLRRSRDSSTSPRDPPPRRLGGDPVTFGARFHAALAERGPFCVGIDPHAALLHDWGLDDDVAGLETFALARGRGGRTAPAPWSSRSRRSTSASAPGVSPCSSR